MQIWKHEISKPWSSPSAGNYILPDGEVCLGHPEAGSPPPVLPRLDQGHDLTVLFPHTIGVLQEDRIIGRKEQDQEKEQAS